MPAYVIFLIHASHDHEALQRYRQAAHPTIVAHGGRVTVARGEQRMLEGNAPAETVIVAFDSMEQAVGWYQSAEYREASRLREGAVDLDAFIVNGLPPAQ